MMVTNDDDKNSNDNHNRISIIVIVMVLVRFVMVIGIIKRLWKEDNITRWGIHIFILVIPTSVAKFGDSIHWGGEAQSPSTREL